jgi:hypothetical protein
MAQRRYYGETRLRTTCGHGSKSGKVRRGLCDSCYLWARKHGYLTEHETVRMPKPKFKIIDLLEGSKDD